MTKLYIFTDEERNKTANRLKNLLEGNKNIWVNVHHRTKTWRLVYQLFLVHDDKIIDCTLMVMIVMKGEIKNEKYLYGSADNLIDLLSKRLFDNYSEIKMNRL